MSDLTDTRVFIESTQASDGAAVVPPGAKPGHTKLYPGPGFRMRHNHDRPPREVVAGLGAFETPEVSDLLNRLYTMNSAIRPVTAPELHISGPACTVKVFPGDNLMVHKALDIAQPGDVIVVDASSSNMTAVLGDTICMKARHRGIAGFVVDGLVRDVAAIQRLGDFPVFARGVTPIGPLQRGPGEINYPVSVGGIVVSAGDLVVADLSGVVVVPADVAPDLLARLVERAPAETAYIADVAGGRFSNDWVDKVLADAGADTVG
jgi:regulator of RNase E activity RraA